MFYVYLLKSKPNNQFYVGSTNDLRRRLAEHNSGKEFSTRRYRPWELVYYEAFSSERLARMREKRLKQHGNALKELKRRLGEAIPRLPSTGLRGAGFTLIEIVIVVTIIALLTVLGMGFFKTQLYKSRDARRKADIKKIQIAAEEYEKDHDCYPKSIACKPGTGLQPYIAQIPCDPLNKASYYLDLEGSSCPSWYRIYARLENEKDLNIVYGSGPANSFNYVAGSPNSPTVLLDPLLSAGSADNGNGNGNGGSGGASVPSGFYACKSGVCEPINWDPTRPGPECDPNFQNVNCLRFCEQNSNCTPWH